MSKRIRVEQGPMGKAGQAIFTVVAFVFIIIGATVAIPMAGLFGVLWTLIALCFFVFGLYGLITGKGSIEQNIIVVEDDSAPPVADLEARLARLQEWYDKGHLTREEYEAQRALIIRQL